MFVRNLLQKPVGMLILSLMPLTFSGEMMASDRDFPAAYQSWKGCEKQEYLWQDRLQPTNFERLPAVGGGWSNLLTGISSLIFLNQTFDHTSDAMPGNRQKIIHSNGSVAPVDITIYDSSPFSGVFAPGHSCGLVRLSLAGSESSVGFTPGMAIKFLIDGKPSVNLHVMHSLNGQDRNRNFFANTFTNSLPAPSGFVLKSLEFTLGLGGRRLRHLPIAHAAVVDVKGVRASSVNAPRQIAFVPMQKDVISSASRQDFRVDLGKIAGNSELYEIHGLDQNNQWVLIGRVDLTAPLTASLFGDKHLFFQHGK